MLPEDVEPDTVLAPLPSCVKQDSYVWCADVSSIPDGVFYVCDIITEWEGKSYTLKLYFKPTLPEIENLKFDRYIAPFTSLH